MWIQGPAEAQQEVQAKEERRRWLQVRSPLLMRWKQLLCSSPQCPGLSVQLELFGQGKVRCLSWLIVDMSSAHVVQQPPWEHPTPQRRVVSTKMNSLIGRWPPSMSRCPQVGACRDVQMTGRGGRRDEGAEEEEQIKVDRLAAT